MSWTEAQRKYAHSEKGIAARKKFMQSEKGKALKAKYLAIRKEKRLAAKKDNKPETKLVNKKVQINKIVNKNSDKLLNN